MTPILKTKVSDFFLVMIENIRFSLTILPLTANQIMSEEVSF